MWANRWESHREMMGDLHSLTLPHLTLRGVHLNVTHFKVSVVHVFVSCAVNGAFSGEFQRVKESLTLDTERAAQLK